jgi:hypothetical protein
MCCGFANGFALGLVGGLTHLAFAHYCGRESIGGRVGGV